MNRERIPGKAKPADGCQADRRGGFLSPHSQWECPGRLDRHSQMGRADVGGEALLRSWADHMDGDRPRVVVGLFLKIISEPFVKSDIFGHQLVGVEPCAAKP